MQRSLPVVAVVLSALALAVSLGRGCSEPAAPAAPAPPPPLAAEARTSDPEIEARLAQLESTASHLVRRVGDLERAASAPRAADGSVPPLAAAEREQLANLRGDVDALLTGEAVDTEAGRAKLKELVRDVQDEVAAERFERRAAEQERVRSERLKKFVEDARLSPTQEAELTKLLDAESANRRAIREQARSGAVQGRELGAQVRALRQSTDAEAKRLLDEHQAQLYDEMRRDERGNRGGARGGQDGPTREQRRP